MARKKAKTSTSPDEDDDQFVKEEEVATQIARVPSRIRRRKGCLQSALNLPLDILHEIFGHVDPLDLIHLSRLTKLFRSFLLNKSSIGVWRSARRNIEGLPECPSFLSEPAYANLMFSPHCHNCFTGNIQNAILSFNIRYCASCKKANTVDSFMLGGRGGYTGGLTEDMFCKTIGERRRVIYHKPDVEEIWHQWLSIREEDEEARERFKQGHRERVQEIHKHAQLCQRWLELRKASRSQELTERKQAKLDIVVDKLRGLGWNEELHDMKRSNYSQLADHVLVRGAKKMNDRAWEAIEPKMIEFMENCKKDRLIKRRRQQLKNRLTWLVGLLNEFKDDLRTTDSDIEPHYVDIALMPEFRELGEAPLSANVTRESYLALRDIVPDLKEQWRDMVDEQLTRIVQLGMKKPPETLDLLCLAMLSFDCSSCRRKGIPYPDVIAHSCLRPHYWSYSRDGGDSAYFYQDVAQNTWHSKPWVCNVTLSRSMGRAKAIIHACGEDPNTITKTEMDLMDPKVCCKTCSRDMVSVVMSWRSAVEHCRIAHSAVDQEEAVWEEVSPITAIKVRAVEDLKQEDLLADVLNSITWSCARCPDPGTCRGTTLARCVEHVRRSHAIPNPNPGDGDLYISADSPFVVKKPVLVVSRELPEHGFTPQEAKFFAEGGGCFSAEYDADPLDPKSLWTQSTE